MAKIIDMDMHLDKELIGYQNKSKKRCLLATLFLCLCIISIFIINFNQQNLFLIPFILGVVSISLFISVVPLEKEMEILQAGIDGEKLTTRCFTLLPEPYTVFHNIIIHYENKSSEVDFLIVGPTGVFVVETKNLNGRIVGNAADTHWVQHKVGRAGTPYSKTFYSPAKQVNTHVYRIANFLKNNGIHTYINAIIYFSNVDTVVNVLDMNEKTLLFYARNDGANKMLQHILNNQQSLTQDEQIKIITLLNKHCF